MKGIFPFLLPFSARYGDKQLAWSALHRRTSMPRMKVETIVTSERVAAAIVSLSPHGPVPCRPTKRGEALTEVDREEGVALLNWSKENGTSIEVFAKASPHEQYDAMLFANGLVEDRNGNLYGSPREWECQRRERDPEEKRDDEVPTAAKPASDHVMRRPRGRRPWDRT